MSKFRQQFGKAAGGVVSLFESLPKVWKRASWVCGVLGIGVTGFASWSLWHREVILTTAVLILLAVVGLILVGLSWVGGIAYARSRGPFIEVGVPAFDSAEEVIHLPVTNPNPYAVKPRVTVTQIRKNADGTDSRSAAFQAIWVRRETVEDLTLGNRGTESAGLLWFERAQSPEGDQVFLRHPKASNTPIGWDTAEPTKIEVTVTCNDVATGAFGSVPVTRTYLVRPLENPPRIKEEV